MSSEQKPSKVRVMHPVALVVFVPVDVEYSETMEMSHGKSFPVPLIRDLSAQPADAAKIVAAATKSDAVSTAFDMLLVAAREIEKEVAGAQCESTAWLGVTDFAEV